MKLEGENRINDPHESTLLLRKAGDISGDLQTEKIISERPSNLWKFCRFCLISLVFIVLLTLTISFIVYNSKAKDSNILSNNMNMTKNSRGLSCYAPEAIKEGKTGGHCEGVFVR